MDTSVLKRDLWEITHWERLASPSFRRSKIYERNSRGYCSMLLPKNLLCWYREFLHGSIYISYMILAE